MNARRFRLCPTKRLGMNICSSLKCFPTAFCVVRSLAKSTRASEQRRRNPVAAMINFSTRRMGSRAHSSSLTRLTAWAKQP